MSLSKQDRIALLEQLLVRIDSRKGSRAQGPSAELVPAARVAADEALDDEPTVDMEPEVEDDDTVIELSGDEEIPTIPEEFEEEGAEQAAQAASLEPEAPQQPVEPIELAEAPGLPMELEPVAPTEPGEVDADALASAPVEPIDLSEPIQLPPPRRQVVAAASQSSTVAKIELDLIEPAKPDFPKAAIELPPRPEPARAPLEARRPVTTVEMPVIPMPGEPAPSMPEPAAEFEGERPPAAAAIESTRIQGRAPFAGSKPVSFKGRLPSSKPRTIADLLRSSFSVGSRD